MKNITRRAFIALAAFAILAAEEDDDEEPPEAA